MREKPRRDRVRFVTRRRRCVNHCSCIEKGKADSGRAGADDGWDGSRAEGAVEDPRRPGPRVGAAARWLGDVVPAGARVERAARRVSFVTRGVRLVVLASPSMPGESFRIAGLVDPTFVCRHLPLPLSGSRSRPGGDDGYLRRLDPALSRALSTCPLPKEVSL